MEKIETQQEYRQNLSNSLERKQDQGNQAIEVDDLDEIIGINLNINRKFYEPLNSLNQVKKTQSSTEDQDPFKMTGFQSKKLAEKQLNLQNLLPSLLKDSHRNQAQMDDSFKQMPSKNERKKRYVQSIDRNDVSLTGFVTQFGTNKSQSQHRNLQNRHLSNSQNQPGLSKRTQNVHLNQNSRNNFTNEPSTFQNDKLGLLVDDFNEKPLQNDRQENKKVILKDQLQNESRFRGPYYQKSTTQGSSSLQGTSRTDQQIKLASKLTGPDQKVKFLQKQYLNLQNGLQNESAPQISPDFSALRSPIKDKADNAQYPSNTFSSNIIGGAESILSEIQSSERQKARNERISQDIFTLKKIVADQRQYQILHHTNPKKSQNFVEFQNRKQVGNESFHIYGRQERMQRNFQSRNRIQKLSHSLQIQDKQFPFDKSSFATQFEQLSYNQDKNTAGKKQKGSKQGEISQFHQFQEKEALIEFPFDQYMQLNLPLNGTSIQNSPQKQSKVSKLMKALLGNSRENSPILSQDNSPIQQHLKSVNSNLKHQNSFKANILNLKKTNQRYGSPKQPKFEQQSSSYEIDQEQIKMLNQSLKPNTKANMDIQEGLDYQSSLQQSLNAKDQFKAKNIQFEIGVTENLFRQLPAEFGDRMLNLSDLKPKSKHLIDIESHYLTNSSLQQNENAYEEFHNTTKHEKSEISPSPHLTTYTHSVNGQSVDFTHDTFKNHLDTLQNQSLEKSKRQQKKYYSSSKAELVKSKKEDTEVLHSQENVEKFKAKILSIVENQLNHETSKNWQSKELPRQEILRILRDSKVKLNLNPEINARKKYYDQNSYLLDKRDKTDVQFSRLSQHSVYQDQKNRSNLSTYRSSQSSPLRNSIMKVIENKKIIQTKSRKNKTKEQEMIDRALSSRMHAGCSTKNIYDQISKVQQLVENDKKEQMMNQTKKLDSKFEDQSDIKDLDSKSITSKDLKRLKSQSKTNLNINSKLDSKLTQNSSIGSKSIRSKNVSDLSSLEPSRKEYRKTKKEVQRASKRRQIQQDAIQLDKNALLKPEDEQKLHKLIKYQTPGIVKAKNIQALDQIMKKFTSSLQASTGKLDQEHELKIERAQKLMMNLKDKKSGRLLTDKEILAQIADLERTIKIMKATQSRVAFNVNFDSAADEVFYKETSQYGGVNNSGKIRDEKTKVVRDLAVMLRRDKEGDENEREGKVIMEQISDYVDQLMNQGVSDQLASDNDNQMMLATGGQFSQTTQAAIMDLTSQQMLMNQPSPLKLNTKRISQETILGTVKQQSLMAQTGQINLQSTSGSIQNNQAFEGGKSQTSMKNTLQQAILKKLQLYLKPDQTVSDREKAMQKNQIVILEPHKVQDKKLKKQFSKTKDNFALQRQSNLCGSPSPIKSRLSLRSRVSLASTAKSLKIIRRKSTLRSLKRQQMESFALNSIKGIPYQLLDLEDDYTFKKEHFLKQINDLVSFVRLCRQGMNHSFRSMFQNDARLVYFLGCIEQLNVALPILMKISDDGLLFLKDYLLSEGQAKAVSKAMLINPEIIRKVFISNSLNGSDAVLALLEGLPSLDCLNSLVLQGCHLSFDAISQLIKLFPHIYPSNLEELRIIDCQIDHNAKNLLLEAFQGPNYIEKLTLSGFYFTKEEIQMLALYLDQSRHLTSLDLSRNQIKPENSLIVLQVLQGNRRLQYVNLSWNLLVPEITPPQIGTFNKIEQMKEQRIKEAIEVEKYAHLKFKPAEEDKIDQFQGHEMESDLQKPESANPDLKLLIMQNQPFNVTISQSLSSDGFHSIIKTTDQSNRDQHFKRSNDKMRFPSKLETNMTNKGQEKEGQQAEDMKKSNKNKMTNLETELLACLTKLISKSEKLIHLDLSDCGLRETVLLNLAKAFKKSLSLLSVHLGGNPGVRDPIVRKIQGKLNATYEKPLNFKNFQEMFQKQNIPFRTQNKSKQRLHLDDGLTFKDEDASQNKQIYDTRENINAQSFSQTNKKLLRDIPELISLKNMKKLKIMYDCNEKFPAYDRQLSFTRIMGHKFEIPGAQNWQMYKESSQECWVCSRKIYTIFFWSPVFGSLDMQKINFNQEEQDQIASIIFGNRDTNVKRQTYLTQVEPSLLTPKKKSDLLLVKENANSVTEFSKSIDLSQESREKHQRENQEALSDAQSDSEFFYEDEQSPEIVNGINSQKVVDFSFKNQKFAQNKNQGSIPQILGQFNNWQPQTMIKLDNLARALDQMRPSYSKPDFFKIGQEQGKIRKDLKDPNLMSRREKERFETLKQEDYDSYKKPEVWGPLIYKFLLYKKPQIVGKENFETLSPDEIYLCAGFVGMGRQSYAVKVGQKLYLHETFSGLRTEEIPVNIERPKDSVLIERTANVFYGWIKDNPDSLKIAVDNDFNYTKLVKSIREEGVKDELKEEIYENFELLKDVYMTLAINSNFPYISMQDFTRFCRNIKIFDKRLTQSRVDYLFNSVKARKTEIPDQFKCADQQHSELNRFEFLEALIQVSLAKYRETGLVVTHREALEHLIKFNLKENFVCASWRQFREEQIWSRPVNLVFDANENPLTLLYKEYADKMTGKVPLKQAVKLLTKDSAIRLHKSDAIHCYGLSLQTCPDVLKLTKQKILSQTYEEFLDMLARAAHIYFSESEKQNLQLWEKVMLLLDELLTLVNFQSMNPRWYKDEESDVESEPATPVMNLRRANNVVNRQFSLISD